MDTDVTAVVFKNMVGVNAWENGTVITERLILCSVDTSGSMGGQKMNDVNSVLSMASKYPVFICPWNNKEVLQKHVIVRPAGSTEAVELVAGGRTLANCCLISLCYLLEIAMLSIPENNNARLCTIILFGDGEFNDHMNGTTMRQQLETFWVNKFAAKFPNTYINFQVAFIGKEISDAFVAVIGTDDGNDKNMVKLVQTAEDMTNYMAMIEDEWRCSEL